MSIVPFNNDSLKYYFIMTVQNTLIKWVYSTILQWEWEIKTNHNGRSIEENGQ